MKFADIDYHIEVMFYEKEKSEKLVNIQEKKKRDDIIVIKNYYYHINIYPIF